jgi:hypothetical protein
LRFVPFRDAESGGHRQQCELRQIAIAENRALAQAMLKVKGVNAAKPGTTVRLPRSRR